jgi:hypothetical protein
MRVLILFSSVSGTLHLPILSYTTRIKEEGWMCKVQVVGSLDFPSCPRSQRSCDFLEHNVVRAWFIRRLNLPLDFNK